MKLLEVKVGDTLRDCDPRTGESHRNKVVISVSADYARVRNGHRETSIARTRIHDDANKKSGYLLIPFSGATK